MLLLLGEEFFVKRAQTVLEEGLVREQHKDPYDVEDGEDAASLAQTLDDSVGGEPDVGLKAVARVDIEPDVSPVDLIEKASLIC